MGKFAKRGLIAIIKIYMKHISPYKQPCCRFYPTCSSYAIEAIDKYGAFRGALLSIWRVLKCNPLNKGGFDPVK